MHDLRHAIRALRTAPIVSAVAIVSLTLGIGANIAVFSIVNAILLKPPPYPDPDRLVLLGYTFSGASVPLVSETKLNVWKEQAAAAWQDVAALRSRRLNLSDGSQAEQVLALQTNTNFFRLFGARAALGRIFTDAEDRPGGDRVVLLSDGFWRRRFGSDPAIVGRPLRIDGTTATIVGVLNADVDTAIFDVAPDVWVPLQLDPNSTDHPPSLIAAARLKPGATIALAQSHARLAGETFHRQFPQASGPSDTFTVAPFHEAAVQNVRASLLVLVGAVVFVLLIACANVANLILIRGSVRQREIAIRTAVGASRWTIVRQLVAEGLMLAFIGGALGFALGEAGNANAPGTEPRRSPSNRTAGRRRGCGLARALVRPDDLDDDGSCLQRMAGDPLVEQQSPAPYRERRSFRRDRSRASPSRVAGGRRDGSRAGAGRGSDVVDPHVYRTEPRRSWLRRASRGHIPCRPHGSSLREDSRR
jgi:predicted permease